ERACRGTGTRKLAAHVHHVGMPAEARKLGDHAAVVGVAAGRRIESTRDGEHEAPLHHNGASYQARADGDSPMVMRSAAISRPSRPSLPPRTASASPSNTWRVRNSVVVLTFLNAATSSRLR